MSSTADDSWPMVEETVFHLFEELTAKSGAGEHAAIGPRLAEMGWEEIEAEYPVEACELLFRAQGRSLAHTDCLDRIMLAELGALLDEPADAVVLPITDAVGPRSADGHISGVVSGALRGRVVVPVSGVAGTVSIAVVDAERLHGHPMDTFDPSVLWTAVHGVLDAADVDASTEWNRAMAAAQRALATELVAVTERLLQIAVGHLQVRVQFGSPIGAFQSPRHLLADAWAGLEGARALLSESWRYGGRLSAQTAKAAAGRAHRAAADAALQVCGAIGLTAEHDVHRYVQRGFQLDALCGSYSQLEAVLADRLFEIYAPGRALPSIIASGSHQ